jgi:uncharacterized RDD family membrane protein YckC
MIVTSLQHQAYPLYYWETKTRLFQILEIEFEASDLTDADGPLDSEMASRLVEKGDEPLDCVVRLVTPERIIVVHPLAGPFRRFAAYLIDLGVLVMMVMVLIVVSIVLTIFSAGSAAVAGPMLVAFFFLSWGYGAFCEGVFNGRTLGKLCLGIRVVSDRGVPISGAQAVLRNLVGAVDGPIPFFFLVGLASMTLSRRFQRLGDLAAGTMVVREERPSPRGFVRIKEPAVDAILPWLPSRIAARSDLARALSDYAVLRARFAPTGRAEIAEPLARALRARFHLAPQTEADAVLCAVYHRVFVGD